MLGGIGREAGERARAALNCATVERWLKQSWCEKWFADGAKQEVLRQHSREGYVLVWSGILSQLVIIWILFWRVVMRSELV